jgi:hypothetical protein
MGFSILPTTRLNHSNNPKRQPQSRNSELFGSQDTPKRGHHLSLSRGRLALWTTNEGITSFLAPKANIKLEDNGPYEILFDPEAPLGFRGTEGCKIIGLEQTKRLSVEWKAPPQFPNVRRQKTHVDIRIETVEALTKVRIGHSGWQWGEEWDEAYEFFDHAWDLDLARMQQTLASGPIDWKKPYVPTWLGHRQQPIRDHVPVETH